MANEIMLALSGEVERNERYQAPAPLSRAGRRDRRHEEEHALAIRDAERAAREAMAAAAVETVEDVVWIQGRARAISELKFAIDRAQKESEVLAQGDPIKQAKYGIIDDDFFAAMRPVVNRPHPGGPPRLFGR